jgi:hypothetical protein
MSIKHSGFLSWVHERNGRLKYKNHAQDCETLTRDQHPAILPWFLYFGWHPSFRSHGHLARYAQRPDCCWTSCLSMIFSENQYPLFRIMLSLAHDHLSKIESPVPGKSCENARKLRA